MVTRRSAEAILPTRLVADTLALATGIATLGVRPVLATFPVSQTLALIQMFFLLAGAVLAGCVTALFRFREPEIGASCSPAEGARIGTRAGLLSVFLASALSSWLARNEVLAATSAADESLLRTRMWSAMLVGVAAMLPAVVGGCIGGALSRRLLLPIPVQFKIPAGALRTTWHWALRVVLSAAGLALLSPLTFIARPSKVNPPPPPVALPSPPPPPPPFQYNKPSTFETAEPEQIVVQYRKEFPAFLPNGPIAITADSRLIAYCPVATGANSLCITNLDSLRTVATFTLPSPVLHTAWASDSKRLISLLGGPAPALAIVDLDTSGVIMLPRPVSQEVPVGRLRWWTPDQVIFYPDDEACQVLNLDTLRVSPLTECARFKTADATTQSELQRPISIAPASKTWRLEAAQLISTVIPLSRRLQGGPWDFNANVAFAFSDPRSEFLSFIPGLTLEQGHWYSSVPDGSKLILTNRDDAEIIYFGVRPARPRAFQVKMPCARGKVPADHTIISSLDSHRLCAFVYGPMVNPLNGKTVGPDRNMVRAILRVVQWDDEIAQCSLAERFQELMEGDVIADLHTWEEGVIIPVKDHGGLDWWVPAGSQSASKPLKLADVERLYKGLATESHFDGYGVQFQRLTRIPPGSEADVTSRPKLASYDSPQAGQLKAPIPRGARSTRAQIEAFIKTHHFQRSTGHLDRALANYDSIVDFLDKGQMTPREIQAYELAQRKLWPHVMEHVQGPISLYSRLEPAWETKYTISLISISSEQETLRAKAEIRLILKETENGLRISDQKVTYSDVQRKSNASGTTEVASGSGPKAGEPPTTSPSFPVAAPRRTLAEIQEFIVAHYGKITAGDIAGVMADCAEKMEFFDKGIMPRADVEQLERTYRKSWPRITATLTGPPMIDEKEGGNWFAMFACQVRSENTIGGIENTVEGVAFHVAEIDGKLRIMAKRSIPVLDKR